MDFEVSEERARAMLAAGTPCPACGSSSASIATEIRAGEVGLLLEHRVVCNQCDHVAYSERSSVPPTASTAGPQGEAPRNARTTGRKRG